MAFTPTLRMLDDAMRFMRVPFEGRDEALAGMVKETFAKLETYVRPRGVWGRFPLSCFAGIELGNDLDKLMSCSGDCCVMAVTLGSEVDRQIMLAQKRGILEGLAVDACASVRADALCDELQTEIASSLGEGEGLTMRFSPGYGDAPLSLSREIIALLDATRRIGLSMTRSLMMTPVKSITALLGVRQIGESEEATNTPRCGTASRCALCAVREGCPYRSSPD